MTPLDLSFITETLAVGGRFARDQTETLAREHRVRAVVDLRDEDQDDVRLLSDHGIEHLHLPTRDLCAVSPEMLDRGVAFAARHLDAGRRTLVHCEHGIGRSVLLALCVLVDRGHAPLDALALAKRRRVRASPSPAQYEAWAAWLRSFRAASAAPTWEVPDFDAFARVAYRREAP
jgi:protein-tyrosine phosphatase